jgi:hypothetical protein
MTSTMRMTIVSIQHARREGDRHGDDAHLHRDARRENDAAVDVAPEIVGAEDVGPGGRLQRAAEVDVVRCVGHDPRPGRGGEDDEQQHDGAREGDGASRDVAEALPPAARGRRWRGASLGDGGPERGGVRHDSRMRGSMRA